MWPSFFPQDRSYFRRIEQIEGTSILGLGQRVGQSLEQIHQAVLLLESSQARPSLSQLSKEIWTEKATAGSHWCVRNRHCRRLLLCPATRPRSLRHSRTRIALWNLDAEVDAAIPCSVLSTRLFVGSAEGTVKRNSGCCAAKHASSHYVLMIFIAIADQYSPNCPLCATRQGRRTISLQVQPARSQR